MLEVCVVVLVSPFSTSKSSVATHISVLWCPPRPPCQALGGDFFRSFDGPLGKGTCYAVSACHASQHNTHTKKSRQTEGGHVGHTTDKTYCTTIAITRRLLLCVGQYPAHGKGRGGCDRTLGARSASNMGRCCPVNRQPYDLNSRCIQGMTRVWTTLTKGANTPLTCLA